MASKLLSATADVLDVVFKFRPSSQGHAELIASELRRLQELFYEDPGIEMKHKKLRNCAKDLTAIVQEISNDMLEPGYQLAKQFHKYWRMLERLNIIGEELRGSDSTVNHICGVLRQVGIGTNFLFTLISTLGCPYLKWQLEMRSIREKIRQNSASMLREDEDGGEEMSVVGFHEDINALEIWLLQTQGDGDGNGNRRQMCIVGPPGAGKTTLLRQVCRKNAVKNHFECRVWVRHSADASLLLYLGTKVTGHLIVEANVDDTRLEISNTLKGRRYLVVLDINIHDLSTWDGIKGAFPDEMNGSRILLTSNLAGQDFNSEFEVREIGSLSQDDLWQLFRNTFDCEAPAPSSSSSSTVLLNELESFVRGCGHLPSEIVNLGAILSMIYERRRELSDVLDFLKHYPPGTMSRIASKYNQLEEPTKLLLLYCGLFPKGFEISRRRLPQFLARHFIIDSIRGIQRVTTEDCLEELVNQDMIQVRKSKQSRVAYCVDSSVHGFSIMKAALYNLFSIKDEEEGEFSSTSPTIALHSGGVYNLISKNVSLQKHLSLVCFPQLTVIGGKVSFPISRFKFLTVLDLEDMYFIRELPEETGELKLLVYLGLRRTGLEGLPSSIGNIPLLGTLDVKHTRVRAVHTFIHKLKYLGYLYIDMDHSPTDGGVSPDLSSSENLCVLSMIPAGSWMKDGLANLTNLRKLGIFGDLDLCGKALINGLPKLQRLENLRLGFAFGDTDPFIESIFPSLPPSLRTLHLERRLLKLPEHAQFLTGIKKLSLTWSQLEQDPMLTLENLQNLEILKLGCASFLGKNMFCSATGYPSLVALELDLLEEFEEWIVEEGAMPKLKYLAISLCKRLKMLPQGLQHSKFLEELQVAGMPNAFNARLEHTSGEDWDKIKHSRSIIIDGTQMAASSSSSPSI